MPTEATPTKIRGVAAPDDPDVESKVTKVIPVLSLLIPLLSVGSGAYVPNLQLAFPGTDFETGHLPTLGRLDTCVQVAPQFVLSHSP